MAVALPHLPDQAGLAILEETGSRSPGELEGLAGLSHDQQTFPTASGAQITDDGLRVVREAVLDVAREHGFPAKKPTRTAGFDRDCAVVLHGKLPITVHTATSRGAWTFLTCVLLVDVAVWRFPGETPARFLGDSDRNTFRRLWFRRELLGPPLEGSDPLWNLEDVLVQVMERPGVSGNRELVRDVSEVYRQRWGEQSGAEREHLMRNFMLRIVRRQELTRLECVGRERRREILREIAAETSAMFETAGQNPAAVPSSPGNSKPREAEHAPGSASVLSTTSDGSEEQPDPSEGVEGLSRSELPNARTSPEGAAEFPRLYLSGKVAEAQGEDRPEGFLVFAGARGRREARTMTQYYEIIRARLIDGGILVEDRDSLILSRDYLFDSASAAAAILSGASRNGRTSWREVGTDKTLKELQSAAASAG